MNTDEEAVRRLIETWIAATRDGDVDACVARATSAGGSVALPKMAVPGIGWLAYVKDPDANIFGMMQTDTEAA